MRALGDIAHARTGDKGNTSIIVVAAWDVADLDAVRDTLRPVIVARRFGVSENDVAVHVVEGLGACTVTIRGCLDGGVTRSRGADPHGKALSGYLLEMEIPRRLSAAS